MSLLNPPAIVTPFIQQNLNSSYERSLVFKVFNFLPFENAATAIILSLFCKEK